MSFDVVHVVPVATDDLTVLQNIYPEIMRRPHRPRLDEALAIASEWSVSDCRDLLERDGRGDPPEYILIHELGIESTRENSIGRTPILTWRRDVKWSDFVDAGLAENHRWRRFDCLSCDGSGRVRDDYELVDCTCDGLGPFTAPVSITSMLALAADWARVRAFEDRLLKDSDAVRWRIRRGTSRVSAAEATKGPRYANEGAGGEVLLAASVTERRLPPSDKLIAVGRSPARFEPAVRGNVVIASFPEL
jgi:hypothetical protein